MSHHRADRTITAEGLTRVEGEGSLRAVVRDGVVTDVELSIFEPPRFFEALLVGRQYTEAPDITSRICGICPVAYQMSACRAIEDVCSVPPEPRIEALRRLLYCGEWISSHALHIYLLHAPDFFGLPDAVALSEQDPVAVRRGLEIKKVGNLIMETVGGRAIHPVNVRVGGFYRSPAREQIAALVGRLEAARDQAIATVAWVAAFDFPDIEQEYHFVALHDPDRYAIESGRVRTSRGLDLSVAEFDPIVVEEHVERSTALHARLWGHDPYLTGPLARYALNGDQLGGVARAAANQAGLEQICTNPFRSIVVRAVELVEACEEALRIARTYDPPDPPALQVTPRAGLGFGATEAPRGILFHRYDLDAAGEIVSARIVPPTSQNQLTIEADLRRVVEDGLDLEDAELTRRCELAVRNHDPCISCAAHFLDVEVAT